MRILIISHNYAPDISPRAFRWAAIAEALIVKGHEVDVISNWRPGLPRHETLKGIGVYRTSNGLSEKLRSRLVPNAMSPCCEGIPVTNVGCGKFELKKACIVAAKWIWQNLHWPDSACLWINPALETANKLFETRSYDVLISVSNPFASHLIGNMIKRKHRELHWMIDIGDPFCYRDYPPANNRLLYNKLNYYIERLVHSAADSISVTTEPTKRKYEAIFPKDAGKIRVIPPLISSQFTSDKETVSYFKDSNKIRFVFVGTFYKNLRSPVFLLELFSRLLESGVTDRLELHIFGNINDCGQDFEPYFDRLDKHLIMNGVVDRDIATLAIQDADILVNIGNDNDYQLPSKVVEYAATGKRVLNIARIDNDSSVDFFKTYPAAISLINSGVEPTAEQINKTLEFVKRPPLHLESDDLAKILEPFQIDSIVAEYIEMITKND